jgi:alcohol dehydrogenase YqhD (iron-dependent ADH family)
MSEVDSSAAPEELIASLKRKRTLTMLFAVGGIVVALAVLFSAAGAMYAQDPVRNLQTEKAALTPADR